MTRKGWTFSLLPLVPLLIVAAYLVSVVVSHGGTQAGPIDIRSSGPTFTTFTELAGASDRVVLGEVVSIEHGRTITDPTDPTAGITTQLATVATTQIAKGVPASTLVVEQEASLLDGTPITVDGVAPLRVGATGWFFLIDGDGEQFPYTALTAPESFVPADSPEGDQVETLVTGEQFG